MNDLEARPKYVGYPRNAYRLAPDTVEQVRALAEYLSRSRWPWIFVVAWVFMNEVARASHERTFVTVFCVIAVGFYFCSRIDRMVNLLAVGLGWQRRPGLVTALLVVFATVAVVLIPAGHPLTYLIPPAALAIGGILGLRMARAEAERHDLRLPFSSPKKQPLDQVMKEWCDRQERINSPVSRAFDE